ncbi:hypothetical protein AHMF7605_04755 [Adhaeribacter arboris]|uniref:Outer membrane protein beta-barrel domain-containing protein n=1 Tax=Adhaeribacter arboris TaxID=2072846 RepID=A0A2T2YBL4_9BACT|nr:outer membrane beta-barrel protein [Adhaeribacter arboris]PSR52883.1 hypothetical protein AHMF7605_04755 [Adhaeribacter arboris]
MQTRYTSLFWISLLLFLLSNKIYGQSNFVKAYLILPSQDTIQGLIDDQNWAKNPKIISFKRGENATIQKYKPGEIRGFSLNSGEQYNSQIVTIDKSPTELATLIEQAKLDNNFVVKDTVFLTVLVKGYAHLYYLKDENAKVHYYLQKPGMSVQELIQRKSISTIKGQNLLVTSDIYKGQLVNIFSDCLSLHSEINKTNYRKNELIQLAQKYNNYKTGATSQIVKGKLDTNVQFGLLAGMSKTNLLFSGNHTNSKLAESKFETNVNCIIGLHLDFIMERSRRKWSMHNELAWKPYQTKATYQTIKSADNYEKGTYTLAFGYVGLTNLLRYTLPFANIKPFINAGLAQNFALTTVNKHAKTTHFYAPDQESTEAALADYRKYEQALVIGTGITANRLSAEIRIEKGNGMSAYTALKSSKQMILALISYRIH